MLITYSDSWRWYRWTTISTICWDQLVCIDGWVSTLPDKGEESLDFQPTNNWRGDGAASAEPTANSTNRSSNCPLENKRWPYSLYTWVQHSNGASSHSVEPVRHCDLAEMMTPHRRDLDRLGSCQHIRLTLRDMTVPPHAIDAHACAMTLTSTHTTSSPLARAGARPARGFALQWARFHSHDFRRYFHHHSTHCTWLLVNCWCCSRWCWACLRASRNGMWCSRCSTNTRAWPTRFGCLYWVIAHKMGATPITNIGAIDAPNLYT